MWAHWILHSASVQVYTTSTRSSSSQCSNSRPAFIHSAAIKVISLHLVPVIFHITTLKKKNKQKKLGTKGHFMFQTSNYLLILLVRSWRCVWWSWGTDCCWWSSVNWCGLVCLSHYGLQGDGHAVCRLSRSPPRCRNQTVKALSSWEEHIELSWAGPFTGHRSGAICLM